MMDVRDWPLIPRLVSIGLDAKSCLREAKGTFGMYPPFFDAPAGDDYDSWIGEKGNKKTLILTNYIAKDLCRLGSVDFDEYRRSIANFYGATVRLSDDLLDRSEKLGIRPEELYILQGKNNPNEVTEKTRLFRLFDDGLLGELGPEFAHDFREVIARTNQAQKDSLELLPNGRALSNERIIDINNRTGGYLALCLDRCLMPEHGDIGELDFNGSYDVGGDFPCTRDSAIFNFGAWLSRVDDLMDKLKDNALGVRTLATRELVTWESLDEETAYAFAGLRGNYQQNQEAVEAVRRRFALFASERGIKLIGRHMG